MIFIQESLVGTRSSQKFAGQVESEQEVTMQKG